MSGIKPAIQDVLTQLATIPVLNQDLQTVPLFTRIFNNQVKRQLNGKITAYPLPAAFVEVIKPSNYNRLLNGVSESDIVFRIHLQHWFVDAQDGTFDQDLPIFDVRDAVIACLSNYRPAACGNLCLTSESQDDDHDDIYVYLLEFTTGFIDSKGSPYDIGRTEFQNSTYPLLLDLIVNNSETRSLPTLTNGYYILYTEDGDGNLFQFPFLEGLSGYAIFAQQLSTFLSVTQGVDVNYDPVAGSFEIVIPCFELLEGEYLIVYPNKLDTNIP